MPKKKFEDILSTSETKRQERLKLEEAFLSPWKAPDRTILAEWATKNVRLPHSARSEDFDISISPWLEFPSRCITDGETKELTMIGAVQGAKTTLAEIAIPYWLTNDPGPIMFNSDTDPNAHDWTESRMYPTLRASPATKDKMNSLSRIQTARDHLKWAPGVFGIFQGAHAKGNLQGKSIRYLINDEPWLYPAGHLAEAYKRVTAFWNRFILNMSTGGELGGELHDRVEISNFYFYHLRCPDCLGWFYPRWASPKGFKDDPKIWGGMRWDSSCQNKETGRWDYNKLQDTIYYSCPLCGFHIKDTPKNRRFMSKEGRYHLEVGGQHPERKAFHYNGIAVDWVPFYVMVEEFTKALHSIRYGDETLLKEFVLKRLAEFWDPDVHRPVVKNIDTKPTLKMREGIKERDFRGGSVDRQHGHVWITIRDWTMDNGCTLVHFERVETGDEADSIFHEFGVEPRFVLCDVANDQTKGLRMCSKYGWTAVQGSDRRSFQHNEAGKKVRRIYAPVELIDPWIGTSGAGDTEVGMIYFSKYSAMERLFALRNGAVDYEWRVPGDVPEEYFRQLDSWNLVDWRNQRTGVVTKEFRQVRKDDHLMMCEVFQIILASIMGVIGSERTDHTQEGEEES